MKIIFFFSFILSLFILFSPQSVQAADTSNCQPIFGGGDSCTQSNEFSINKAVATPGTSSYTDNLSMTDPKYTPGQTVLFRISVNNTTNKTISNIKITDAFPQYLTFRTGNGKFDSKTNSFTFTIDKLDGKSTKVFFLSGTVVSKDKLPNDRSIICVVNQAIASANNKASQDNTQFCITKEASAAAVTPQTTKGGLQVHEPTQSQTTPSTGPEALSIISLIPAAAAGLWLRRKTKTFEKNN